MQAESKVEMHRSGGSSASDVSSTLASCLGGRLRSPPNCAKRPFFRRAQVRLAFDGAIDERRELLGITEVRLRLLIRPRRVIGSAWEVLRDAGGGPLHYREITKHRRCSTFSGGGNLESRPRSFAPTSVAFAWLSRCCSSIPVISCSISGRSQALRLNTALSAAVTTIVASVTVFDAVAAGPAPGRYAVPTQANTRRCSAPPPGVPARHLS